MNGLLGLPLPAFCFRAWLCLELRCKFGVLLMLADRGIIVNHTTDYRWIQTYAPELEQRPRPLLRRCNGSWRVDETYIEVRGR